jgi:hypothetical protein
MPPCAMRHGGRLWRADRLMVRTGCLSFSPELFFALNGAEAKVKPMKGTRPRGADPAADARAGRGSRRLGERPRREPDDRRSDAQRSGARGRGRQRGAWTQPSRSRPIPRCTRWCRPCAHGCAPAWARWIWSARCSPAARSPARPRSARWNCSPMSSAMRAGLIAARSGGSMPLGPTGHWRCRVQRGDPHSCG